MSALHAEFQKAKRRHDLLVCLLVPLTILLWASYAKPKTADALACGYRSLLYSLPVMNAVLMPVAMALLASRLWDVEVKGCTPKLLYTLQSRRSLFAAKAAFGFGEVLLLTATETLLVPLLGHVRGYTEALPAAQLVYFLVCTLCVNTMLFFSELLLAIRLESPMPVLSTGIVGALLGLFSAFMPKVFGYFVVWGYYVLLSGYEMSNWDREARTVTYTARAFDLPLLAWVIFLAGALFYFTWRAVNEKEV